MSNELEKRPENSVFATSETFDQSQRVAKMLASSTIVPKEYQNNISNTLVALEMANRIGASPLMVMQNLNVIHGRPSWGSSFIIAALNSCGRFEPLEFIYTGTPGKDDWSCHVETTNKKTGKTIKGISVSISMAKAEGWMSKAGSKWQTMPELMLSYRAAAFFGRLHAPDILQGMHTSDEVQDIHAGGTEDVPAVIVSINKKASQAQPADDENETELI